MRIAAISIFGGLLLAGCRNEKDVSSLTASGTIEAVDVIVSSKTAGQILKINAREGDRVRTGDVLVEIEHELLDIQLRQAEAGVELALAQLRLLQSGARREDVRQAEEVLKQAKINLDLAEEDKNRMEQMFKEGAVTEKQYEDAVARHKVALAQHNSAAENLRKIKTMVRPQEIESAQANVKSATARVEQLKKSIADCIVKAPVDGIVSNKFVEVGENASIGSSLVKISSLDKVELVIYVPERELGKVKLGQKAEVTVDAFENKIFGGEIIFISPEAEFTPKNIQTPEERTKLVFAVKIEIPNAQYELKPGMPADAHVLLNEDLR